MTPGQTTRLAFVDTETLSLERTAWEVAVILADLTYPLPYDQSNGARPKITVTETWVGFLDVDRDHLRFADPKSLQLNRFYERHPRYRLPLRDRGNGHPAHTRDDVVDPDDAVEFGTYWGAGNLVWHRDAAAYELARLLAGRTVVGAIPWFDTDKLNELVTGPLAVHYHLIDVEALLAGHIAGRYANDMGCPPAACLPPYSPTELTKLAGIPKLDETAHEAWADCRWNLDVVAYVWDAEVIWPPPPDAGPVPAGPDGEVDAVDVPPTGGLRWSDRPSDDGFPNVAINFFAKDPAPDVARRIVERLAVDDVLGREPTIATQAEANIEPIVYPGQHVEWDEEDAEGNGVTRRGVLREQQFRRWALVMCLPGGETAQVRLHRLRHAAEQPGWTETEPEPRPATPDDIRAARGEGRSHTDPIVFSEVDYGDDAPPGPPGDPSRNVVPTVEEALADKLEEACTRAGIQFDNPLDLRRTLAILAGVVADATADRDRRIEALTADYARLSESWTELLATLFPDRRSPRISWAADARDLRDAYDLLKRADDERRTVTGAGIKFDNPLSAETRNT